MAFLDWVFLMIKSITLRKNPFDPREHEREIQRNLDNSADRIKDDLGLTVKTWKTKPKFNIKGRGYKRIISTDSKEYYFVSGGTRVRYATMTSDFSAKTRAGRFQAGAGRGGVLFINKKKPRPGIKARKFDKQEVKRANKWLPKEFNIEVK